MAGHHGDEDTATLVITEKVVIEDLLQACPQAEAVLRKYLGSRALCVPGSKTETIEFLAAMHDTHVHPIIDELNEVCKVKPLKLGHF
ncbi:MAG: hypothetical protein ACE5EI_05955 [Thermodesulfobacteriota bacterium]